MTIQELCAELNKVYTCGTFQVMDEEMMKGCGFEVSPSHIAIFYDYCDDELSDSESDDLVNWLYHNRNGGHRLIEKWMYQNGYELVDDLDGSGGGLYYGGTLYKKV